MLKIYTVSGCYYKWETKHLNFMGEKVHYQGVPCIKQWKNNRKSLNSTPFESDLPLVLRSYVIHMNNYLTNFKVIKTIIMSAL